MAGLLRLVSECSNRSTTTLLLGSGGLRPEVVPGVEVLEVLPTVSHTAVLELEDDAVGYIQVAAVPVRGAALDTDHGVVAVRSHVLQLGAEGAATFLRQPAEIRQGRVAALV